MGHHFGSEGEGSAVVVGDEDAVLGEVGGADGAGGELGGGSDVDVAGGNDGGFFCRPFRSRVRQAAACESAAEPARISRRVRSSPRLGGVDSSMTISWGKRVMTFRSSMSERHHSYRLRR